MDKVKKGLESSYIPFDLSIGLREWNKGAEVGLSSGAKELDGVLKHKPGFINGWYGWPNDGKGTFYDWQAILSAKLDGWKFCMFKPEDMSAHRMDGQVYVNAVDILHNLMWTYTGKTPYKHIAERYHVPQLTKDEYLEAHEWISDHFFIVYPRDRKYKNILDEFRFMFDKHGINRFLIDPFRGLILEGKDREAAMNQLFFDAKEFALGTNTILDFIAHPKSQNEVKVSKKEDAAYKVVDQWMISGGAAWDNAMDSQYSIYRPERHLSPVDPKVHFINLKQRKSEIVGANRGQYNKIVFNFLEKRYYLDGICPISGKMMNGRHTADAQGDIFAQGRGEKDVPVDPDKLPF